MTVFHQGKIHAGSGVALRVAAAVSFNASVREGTVVIVVVVLELETGSGIVASCASGTGCAAYLHVAAVLMEHVSVKLAVSHTGAHVVGGVAPVEYLTRCSIAVCYGLEHPCAIRHITNGGRDERIHSCVSLIGKTGGRSSCFRVIYPSGVHFIDAKRNGQGIQRPYPVVISQLCSVTVVHDAYPHAQFVLAAIREKTQTFTLNHGVFFKQLRALD